MMPRATVAEAAEVAALLKDPGTRLVSIFGRTDPGGRIWVHYIVDHDNRQYRVLSSPVQDTIQSLAPAHPAAAWYERQLQDQFGIRVAGHPDPRPLLFHQNTPAGVPPMAREARDFSPAPAEYPFLKVDGVGVCEVPVGPVHAGIIEPGHFRFSAVGDTVLHLELRHFYTHKGAEKLFEGTPVRTGAMIAESVSGDNCFSHAVAYCQAVETACAIAVPPRAESLRMVGLELERLMAHIADVGALCGDVGFSVPAAYTGRLKEALLRESAELFGTRYWRGISFPGGVSRDVSSAAAHRLRQTIAEVAREFAELAHRILDTPSVQNRFEATGMLKQEIARQLAVVGLVARASGVRLDVRCDHPYGAYRNCQLEPVVYHYGDVLARARVRIDETAASARLIETALNDLPAGEIATQVEPAPDGQGYSAVESTRGELLYWIEVRGGRIARCHIKSPSFQNWPALPLAMPGNIIADFPLINKSFNLSYSGCDR